MATPLYHEEDKMFLCLLADDRKTKQTQFADSNWQGAGGLDFTMEFLETVEEDGESFVTLFHPICPFLHHVCHDALDKF